MTTPIVPSITDEQLAEIEVYSNQSGFEDKDAAQLSVGELRGIIARLRAAEKDAARYRWIRGTENKVVLTLDGREEDHVECLESLSGESLDSAIDTAMEQSK